MYDVLLIRYGEIGLKGKNRYVFENQLLSNVRKALQDLEEKLRVYKTHGRVFVEVEDGVTDTVIQRVSQVFGVVSVSPSIKTDLDLSAIRAAAVQVLEDAIGSTSTSSQAIPFKVEARRANKSFPLDSMALNREIGAALLEALPQLTVDLHNPEHRVRVEVRDREAYVYAEAISGPGGLPVGSSSPALLLLSGGIDSPVAGWLAMKRGIPVQAIHFYSFPFTSERSLQKVLDLAGILGRFGKDVPVHVVFFTEIQKAIHKSCPESLGITVMRRMMYRLAEQIARQHNIPALLTGESVGQVASQTLESMAVINAVTSMPVLRPVITMDKREIINISRSIKTYDISVLPYEDCCTLFLPKHPETRPRLDRTVAAEAALDIEGLLTEALERTETVQTMPEE